MKLINSELLFEGKYLDLFKDIVINTNGQQIEWERCSRKNNTKAVMIVAYHIEKQKYVMISEYRIPIKGRELGFPAGLIDKKNDNVEKAIRRELKEETGLDLVEIKYVSPFVYSSSGMTDESISIAFVTVSGELTTQYNESSEDIIPMLVSENDIKYFLSEPNIKWGAKAWIICFNIITPNIFKHDL